MPIYRKKYDDIPKARGFYWQRVFAKAADIVDEARRKRQHLPKDAAYNAARAFVDEEDKAHAAPLLCL